jgi:hypothetical protein
MRDEVLVVLAAASSMVFSMAGARERSNSQPPADNIARESSLVQGPARRRDLIIGLDSRRVVSSSRMITWSVCGAPSSGSALFYARKGHPLFASIGDAGDDRSELCAADDE